VRALELATAVLLKQKQGSQEKILLLDRSKVAKAIEKIGWLLDPKGVIYTKEGNLVTCRACGDALRIDNLGSFFPGSIEPVCSKFQCFLSEMARVDSKLRERRE
jgi:hypothetical protein